MNEVEREISVQNIDSSLAELVTRAEYDVQIATAKRYPRSIQNFMTNAREMVTLNEQVAQECIYALPRDGKTIEGPSARFAEIMLHAWGHIRAGARIVNEDAKFVTAQGVCHDLQSNTLIAYEIKRRITKSNGQRYNDDMIGTTGNAASSIALRNAILKVIPKAFWSSIYGDARKVIVGDSTTLTSKRANALEHMQKFGVTKERVFQKLGVNGANDITTEHLVLLFGIMNALKDGDTTVEEQFPPTQEEIAKHIKEVSEHATQVSGIPGAHKAEPEKKAEPTSEELDWKYAIEEIVSTLNKCNSQKEVSDLIEERSKLLEKVSKMAPKEVQEQWGKALTAKMKTFQKPPADAKPAEEKKGK